MRIRYAISCAVLALTGSTVLAQTASVRVEVRAESGPVTAAEVIVDGASHKTDLHGIVVVPVPADLRPHH